MKPLRTTFLVPLLVTIGLSSMPRAYGQDSSVVIPIVAKKFEYTPKEIHLKAGQSTTLVLTSEDVTHGLKSKELGIDTLIPPGKETRVTITPEKPGTYTAYCSKFCGIGHFGMKMTVIVE